MTTSVLCSGKMGVAVKKLNWLQPDMEMERSDNIFGWLAVDLKTLKQVKIFLAADGKVSLFMTHYSKNTVEMRSFIFKLIISYIMIL